MANEYNILQPTDSLPAFGTQEEILLRGSSPKSSPLRNKKSAPLRSPPRTTSRISRAVSGNVSSTRGLVSSFETTLAKPGPSSRPSSPIRSTSPGKQRHQTITEDATPRAPSTIRKQQRDAMTPCIRESPDLLIAFTTPADTQYDEDNHQPMTVRRTLLDFDNNQNLPSHDLKRLEREIEERVRKLVAEEYEKSFRAAVESELTDKHTAEMRSMAADLHTQYSEKHTRKVASLKEAYRSQYEKKIAALEARIVTLQSNTDNSMLSLTLKRRVDELDEDNSRLRDEVGAKRLRVEVLEADVSEKERKMVEMDGKLQEMDCKRKKDLKDMEDMVEALLAMQGRTEAAPLAPQELFSP